MDSSTRIAVIKNEPNSEHIDGLLDMLDRNEVELVESVVVLDEEYKPSEHKDSRSVTGMTSSCSRFARSWSHATSFFWTSADPSSRRQRNVGATWDEAP